MEATQYQLIRLFEQHLEEQVTRFEPLAASGSSRRYYRLGSASHQVIGTYNDNPRENEAFFYFSKHFQQKGIRVPDILAADASHNVYLQTDLGDLTLLQFLEQQRPNPAAPLPHAVKAVYRQVVRDLAYLQIKGDEGLDYQYCFPTARFDRRSMLWDCNYFKYYFLRLVLPAFDEQRLDEDFERLTRYLERCEMQYFVYRDFQARNIMLHGELPYYIDYQGGRKGAMQYDLASLLFQAKAQLHDDDREWLLDEYMAATAELRPLDAPAFRRHYYAFVLIRCVQVLGAYGFRGLYERKAHFLSSIPHALRNISWILENVKFRLRIPYLLSVLEQLVQPDILSRFETDAHPADRLTVSVNSFSYRRGVPPDTSGNGGGFVFDCRALHNPGRYAAYKKLTGRDEEVIAFFEKEPAVDTFLKMTTDIVAASVAEYVSRKFTSLVVNFGCTGGQHRSVYCADRLVKDLRERFDERVYIHVQHVEQELKNWKNE